MEPAKPRWFEDAAGSKALSRPNEILQSHQSFQDHLKSAIKSKDGEVKLASTKEELLDQIEEARGGLPRRESAIRNFRAASATHHGYVLDRQQGIKKVSKWAQGHANTFGQLVEKYSKVIEAVATAGGPYGTVAYQTFSILLSVCVNKVKNDNKVIDLLEELRKSLPKLENWDNIYPTDVMRGLVATAYAQVIDFSRRAAEYLSRFRKRFLFALLPALASGFDETAAEIHKTLAEINAEAMYELHKTSQRTEAQVNNSAKTIEHLKKQAEEAKKGQQELLVQNRELKLMGQEAERMRLKLLSQNEELKEKLEQQERQFKLQQEQDDKSRLTAFENVLEISYPHPGTNILGTKKALMEIFPDLPANAPNVPYTGYLQMSRFLLNSQPEFQDWNENSASSLLFVSGSTAWQGRRKMGFLHCWLSPVAIYVAEDALQKKEKMIFFSCLPMLIDEPISAHTVISSIIIQILHQKPEMLRDNYDRFRRYIAKEGVSWSFQSLLDGLIQVLNELRDPIVIIIDRLDLAYRVSISTVLNGLAQVITAVDGGSSKVKIMVIAETSRGNAEWRSDWLSKHDYALNRIFAIQDWPQLKLTTLESSRRDRPLIWDHESLIPDIPIR